VLEDARLVLCRGVKFKIQMCAIREEMFSRRKRYRDTLHKQTRQRQTREGTII